MGRRDAILAAAAHLAVFASWPGAAVSTALWLLTRRHRFAHHHAGQAALYQAAVLSALPTIGWLLPHAGPLTWLLGTTHLAAMAYGAYAAMSALDGRLFRYLG